MKTIRNLVILFIVTAISYNAHAFSGKSEKTEVRNLKNFDVVKVSTGIDVYLKMGDTEEVKVVADDDIIEKLITEVNDGVLSIYMKKTNWNWNFNETRKVYVTIKELKRIDASSGSEVKSENTLKGETLKVRASSGSEVTLNVIYKNFSVDTSSGSEAKISGKTKNMDAEASSGSEIKAEDLESVICKVNASSGSDIVVKVSEEIYAKASSGADIRYYGNPQIKDINESSGGDVRKR
jgi:hypothetical protein